MKQPPIFHVVLVMIYLGLVLSWIYFNVLAPPIDCLEVVDGKLRYYAIACNVENSKDEHTYAVGCRWFGIEGCNISKIPNRTQDNSCISYNIISLERGVYLSSECLMENIPNKDVITIFSASPYYTEYTFSVLEAEQKDAVSVYFENEYSNQSET